MEILTIDILKISGEYYSRIEKEEVVTTPTFVDENTTTVIPILEGVEIKVSDSLEELTNELLQLGYTIPDNTNLEQYDNNS